jgi:hypothetical protein
MSVTSYLLKKGIKGYRKGTNFASDQVSKVADFGMKGLIKETPPTFLNAYTGLGPTKAATGLFVAGAAAYGTYATLKGEHNSKAMNAPNEFVGPAPIMSGDGVGNKSNAPTLGANGSLVFGLHNRR